MQYTIKDILNNQYENHVFPFFWQKGKETDETIIEYIQKMYEADIREFCVESRPFDGFCEEPWWNRLSLIIREAKKRGMKIWILDDFHFPTGSANKKVKDYPELNKKVIKYHMISAIGPHKNLSVSIKQPFPVDHSTEFLGAVAVSDNQVVLLKNEIINDFLYFDLPKGRWDIYVLNISSETDVAPNYINMVDKESCEILIKEVYEKHYEQFENEFGKTILGFFSDEPGFQNEKGVKSDSLIGKEMPLPWSQEVREDLITAFGDNYIKKLPHLWININEETPEIRKKYMDIVTNLYKENFSKAIGEWCRKHQVRYIGHIIEDRESHARLGVGAGHYYRSLIGQDMAGSDIISNQLIPGLDSGLHSWARGVWDGEFFHYALGKMTSSLARIDQKKRGNSMTEVFGAYGWHEGTKLMKWIIDHLLVRGVNHFVPHAFSPAPFPDDDCPPHFYSHGQNPQFRYFKKLMTYTNKMCTLLSNGETIPEAAVIYHAESEWTGNYMSCQKPARVLTQNQIEFDIIPNDIFKNENDYQVTLKDELIIHDRKYPILIVPYCEYIDDDLYHFICRSRKTKVIFIEGYPKATFENRYLINEKELAQKSMIMNLKELEEYLKVNKISKIQLEQSEPYLRAQHYQKGIEEFYMFFNEHPNEEIKTTFKVPNLSNIHRLDLLNNRIIPVKESTLTLAPYESCIIFGATDHVEYSVDTKIFTNKLCLSEKTKISFATAKEFPNFSKEVNLENLVDVSKTLAPNFAGTIRYKFIFQSGIATKQVKVSLEEVYEIAEVTLNGKNLGAKICPPYDFFEGELIQGENLLVIDVTNTLDKKIYEKHSAAQVRQPSGILKPVLIYY